MATIEVVANNGLACRKMAIVKLISLWSNEAKVEEAYTLAIQWLMDSKKHRPKLDEAHADEGER